MTAIGPFIIVKKAQFPNFEKANKLARCLSHIEIEDILEGRRHIHRNPKKRVFVDAVGTDGCKAAVATYPAAGE